MPTIIDGYILIHDVLMDRESLVIEEVWRGDGLNSDYLCLFDEYKAGSLQLERQVRSPWRVHDRRESVTCDGHDLRDVDKTYGWFISAHHIEDQNLDVEKYLRLRNVNDTPEPGEL